MAAPSAAPSLLRTLATRLSAVRAQHPRAEAGAFFSAGFLLDIVTIERIDSGATIAQHAAFLLALGALLCYEQRHELGLAQPPPLVARAWRFSEDAMHYLLGTLLSAFCLFYFKS